MEDRGDRDDEISTASDDRLWPATLTPLRLIEGRAKGVTIADVAAEAVRARIAADLDLAALDRLELSGVVAARSDGGAAFEGQLRADGAQRCVASLAPVAFAIDAPVRRVWLPPDLFEAQAHLEADPNDLEEGEELGALDLGRDGAEDVDPLTDPIDFGAVGVEELALSLDPYPRAAEASPAGALASPPGAEPLTDEAARPFAGLAALKRAAEAARASAPDKGEDEGENGPAD